MRHLATSMQVIRQLRRTLLVPAMLASGAYAASEESWSATDVVFCGPGVQIYVPHGQAEQLRPTAERLMAAWVQLDRQLRTPMTGCAVLQLTDRDDLGRMTEDGGFGRLGMVGLAADPLGPGGPRQIDARGRRALARIGLTQRIPGWRGGLARILGEQMPNDVLGFASMLLVLPAADSFPPWWTEALLAWYARHAGEPVDSPYRTLGRTVLRLEAEAMADPAQWRTDAHTWPYDLRASAYGWAYGEALAERYPMQMAAMADAHAGRVPFWFAGAPEQVAGRDHRALLADIAAEIADAQRRDVAAIRSAGVQSATRLTPVGVELAEVAWQDNDVLVVRENEVFGAGSRIVRRHHDGQLLTNWLSAAPLGDVACDIRRGADGRLLGTATGMALHGRSRSSICRADATVLSSLRVRQADAAPDGAAFVAIQLCPGGSQQLVHISKQDGNQYGISSTAAIPDDATPWAPSMRPDGQAVVWIERTATSSRVVQAAIPGFGGRQVLWEVPGAMLHPCYVPDGSAVIICSDNTGIFNAWRVPLDGQPPEALTNTLGSVMACVPSPDGSTLAIIDFDRDGAYLGLLPASTRANPPQLRPQPAPQAQRAADARLPPVDIGRGDGLHDIGYRGLVPTTSASSQGEGGPVGTSQGLGLQAHFGDPVFRSHAVIGAGTGASDQIVGIVRYESFHLSPVQLAAEAHRHSDVYDELIATGSGRSDYAETVAGGRMEVSFVGMVGLAVGMDRRRGVADANTALTDQEMDQTFQGNERYADLHLGIDTRPMYPLSIAPETGIACAIDARHSGLGGDLQRNRVIAQVEGTWSTWPEQGHQLVGRIVGGWSDGDASLQGAFAVGGKTQNTTTILRGYREVQAVDDHLGGWSLAYRLPLWRPQFGSGTQPWYLRQFVLEGFVDAAQTSSDHAFGNGPWYRSVGGQFSADIDLWIMRLSPGISVARQLDGEERWQVEFMLGSGASF
ncbi:MAG: hypothetical protein J0M02_03215 [Planctomycetes bacterium]|nr:hypothetical protein [Planctomycetota bacterium]